MHNNCNGHVNLQFAFSTSANLLKTLLIGYLYISDMRYKIKGELFLCQNYHKSISKNIKSDTFGKQVFCNPTIWTNDFP